MQRVERWQTAESVCGYGSTLTSIGERAKKESNTEQIYLNFPISPY
jgi:hypothetical protein